MSHPTSETHCPSCGVNFGILDSDPVSSEPYMIPKGASNKHPIRNQGNDGLQNSHGSTLVKCDLIGSQNSPDDPPRYSPCRQYGGHHHHQHHHYPQERLGSKVVLSLPKVPLIGKSNNQGISINDKKVKSKMPLKYISKVQRCPDCAGKCYIEPIQRPVNRSSLSAGDNQLFPFYCSSCSKSGLARLRGPAENGNYVFTGTIDKHLTYYSTLPRLWDTEMWHRKRKRASIKKNETMRD